MANEEEAVFEAAYYSEAVLPLWVSGPPCKQVQKQGGGVLILP